ncbi:MAG: MFS transporter [Hyphomicrobiaceae bacterium]
MGCAQPHRRSPCAQPAFDAGALVPQRRLAPPVLRRLRLVRPAALRHRLLTTQLTTVVGFDLVLAGQALAAYQLSGVISRPIWGWLADNVLAARWLLALQGAIMCGAAFLAGRFAPGWPPHLIFLVCIVAGATASGFTGIAYGEYARLGGSRRTEATGVGSAFMFAGVMALPSATSAALTLLGSYTLAYSCIGLLALAAGVMQALPRRETPPPA